MESTRQTFESILDRVPALRIGILGDLFLDRYLDIDGTLTEPSIETGLDAYQVVRVRSSPGAAGTVINNLVALGVGHIIPIAVIGADGEGYELRRALERTGVVDLSWVIAHNNRRTPTYTKPMLAMPGQQPRELNRLDIKNRSPLPTEAEEQLLLSLERAWEQIDALVVLDQVSEPECGVITTRIRDRLAELGQARTDRPVLADSRERIGLFRYVMLKPNERECLAAVRASSLTTDLSSAVCQLAGHSQRPVFCTRGQQGILLATSETSAPLAIPARTVTGPTDPVGAGDSTSAGIICALAAGTSLEQAAAFGNLVASITVQQLGTTGTATPAQIRQRSNL